MVPTTDPDRPEPASSNWARVGWFVLIWTASVSALAVVAFAIRWIITP